MPGARGIAPFEAAEVRQSHNLAPLHGVLTRPSRYFAHCFQCLDPQLNPEHRSKHGGQQRHKPKGRPDKPQPAQSGQHPTATSLYPRNRDGSPTHADQAISQRIKAHQPDCPNSLFALPNDGHVLNTHNIVAKKGKTVIEVA